MASEYDLTEFVDADLLAQKSPSGVPVPAGDPHRALTREDVDRKVVEAQQKLAELKRAQEELERERAALEELRRRQTEFQTGRQEMVHSLTRGLGQGFRGRVALSVPVRAQAKGHPASRAERRARPINSGICGTTALPRPCRRSTRQGIP